MNRYAKRLWLAFFASVGIHLILLEVWAVMLALHVMTGRSTPKPPPPKIVVPVLTFIEPKKQIKPMTFVETDSTQASQQVPKDSKYYSSQSSLAANPKPGSQNADNTPKLEGSQDKVPSTANVTLPQPVPTPDQAGEERPKPEKAAPQPETKPTKKPDDGSVSPEKKQLAMLTKEAQHKTEPAKPPKPKTEVTETKLVIPKTERLIPEAESKTDGGVSREGPKAFDVTGVLYGEYDRRLVAAVKIRWLALVDQHTIPGERSGQVTIRFHLNDDGSVTELAIAETTAGDMLALYCQKSITDSAPFGPWPDDLKNLVKRNYRELSFTFYYVQ